MVVSDWEKVFFNSISSLVLPAIRNSLSEDKDIITEITSFFPTVNCHRTISAVSAQGTRERSCKATGIMCVRAAVTLDGESDYNLPTGMSSMNPPLILVEPSLHLEVPSMMYCWSC